MSLMPCGLIKLIDSIFICLVGRQILIAQFESDYICVVISNDKTPEGRGYVHCNSPREGEQGYSLKGQGSNPGQGGVQYSRWRSAADA